MEIHINFQVSLTITLKVVDSELFIESGGLMWTFILPSVNDKKGMIYLPGKKSDSISLLLVVPLASIQTNTLYNILCCGLDIVCCSNES